MSSEDDRRLLLTAVTPAAGFKGDEVAPLFFIGATLGNTLAWVLDQPIGLHTLLRLQLQAVSK